MTYNMSAPLKVEPAVLTVLWKGTLFGICTTSIYHISTRPDIIIYEFHDTPPVTLTPLELHNFYAVKEYGEFVMAQQGDDVEELVDILISQLEQRYISGTLVAYNKELSNGIRRH